MHHSALLITAKRQCSVSQRISASHVAAERCPAIAVRATDDDASKEMTNHQTSC
jgi:DNA-binding transcriptional regulator YdaS (Cro superfamily)